LRESQFVPGSGGGAAHGPAGHRQEMASASDFITGQTIYLDGGITATQ
jgi:hypothetical protein